MLFIDSENRLTDDCQSKQNTSVSTESEHLKNIAYRRSSAMEYLGMFVTMGSHSYHCR